jgi:phosphoribosylanthranilate isomerase
MRTRVKICGITRPEDGQCAAELGVDAIGLVFYASSPRAVGIETAQAICKVLPPFVSKVGLFVNAPRAEIQQVLEKVPLDVLQFHGDEAPADCEGFGRPYIKALRMAAGIDVLTALKQFPGAAGILLDSYQAGVPGGTGQTFDWSRVPTHLGQAVIPQNVAMAIEQVRPYAVDVSGGVEATKGIKDRDKMTAFMNEVQRVGTSKETH